MTMTMRAARPSERSGGRDGGAGPLTTPHLRSVVVPLDDLARHQQARSLDRVPSVGRALGAALGLATDRVRSCRASRTRACSEHDALACLSHRLDRAHEATVAGLLRALAARDGGTADHVGRVRSYSLLIGRALGLGVEALRQLDMGAALHDIGKIGIPDAVLKKPGPLSPEEQALMRRHVEIGRRIVADISGLAEVVPVVAHHHERWDGMGYPDRLAGTAIPLAARIVAVADAFDAMTSDRPYRSGLTVEAALLEVEQGRGTQFDPDIADALLRCLGSLGRPVR